MAFLLERDMTELTVNNIGNIAKSIKKAYSKENLVYACEFPVYHRLIDIVIATFYSEYNNFDECISYEKAIGSISNREFSVLNLISLYKKVSISRISNELLLDINTVEDCVNKLCKLKLINKVSRSSYEIGDWSVLIPKNLIALELKLSRWNEALEQGIYNKSFAEYSFVVLDEDKVISNINIEEQYKFENVGLIYLNSDGKVRIRYIPKKNKNIDKYINQYHKIKVLKDFMSNKNKWKEVP